MLSCQPPAFNCHQDGDNDDFDNDHDDDDNDDDNDYDDDDDDFKPPSQCEQNIASPGGKPAPPLFGKPAHVHCTIRSGSGGSEMENRNQEVLDQVLDFNIERIRSIQGDQGQEESQKHDNRDQGGDLVIRVIMTMTMMMMTTMMMMITAMMMMMVMQTCSGTCLTTVAHSGTL